MEERQNGKLKVYTRSAQGEYTLSLANSVHFAYAENGEDYQPLNGNYGMLFAKAEISEENQIVEKGLSSPGICWNTEKGFCVTAVRTNGDGSRDEACAGKVLLWTTQDFIHFEEHGLVDRQDTDSSDVIAIPRELGRELLNKWTYPYGTEYRDRVTEEMLKPRYGFPLAKGYADPDVCLWKGEYYFTSTNDNTGAIGLYVRHAQTVSGLFEEGVKEYLILDKDPERGLIQTFWAPELHIINGDLYILFAVSAESFGPQCHMMKLKENGNVLEAEDWENPKKVVRADGCELYKGGITLDMTYLKVKEISYLVWSARRNCCAPGDTGSMLYIATVDEKKPWILTSEPVLLSRPLYGWENNAGTINNEGPYALIRENMVYLMYSGGAAGGDSYVIGCLSISGEEDLLDPAKWEKSKVPLLSTYLMEGIYGPGHNSFVVDENKDLLLLYHAQESSGRAQRCVGIHKVHFTKEGYPVLAPMHR